MTCCIICCSGLLTAFATLRKNPDSIQVIDDVPPTETGIADSSYGSLVDDVDQGSGVDSKLPVMCTISASMRGIERGEPSKGGSDKKLLQPTPMRCFDKESYLTSYLAQSEENLASSFLMYSRLPPFDDDSLSVDEGTMGSMQANTGNKGYDGCELPRSDNKDYDSLMILY